VSIAKFKEIERLVSELLKDVATNPIEGSATKVRVEANMRLVAELDHSFAADAHAITAAAKLLYGADRSAVRNYPGGQQRLKSELAGRLKTMKEQAIAKRVKISEERG